MKMMPGIRWQNANFTELAVAIIFQIHTSVSLTRFDDIHFVLQGVDVCPSTVV